MERFVVPWKRSLYRRHLGDLDKERKRQAYYISGAVYPAEFTRRTETVQHSKTLLSKEMMGKEREDCEGRVREIWTTSVENG